MRYYLLIPILVVLLLQGCCSERETHCISINTTYVVAYNNNGEEPVPAKQTEVYGKALLLELNLDRHVEVCYEGHSKGFFNAAYASKCVPVGDDKYIDSVTHVSIFADKDYDESHPAGTELNDYFKMPDISDYNDGSEATAFRIYSLKSPQHKGEYTYTIKLVLADGSLIEATTDPINIIP